MSDRVRECSQGNTFGAGGRAKPQVSYGVGVGWRVASEWPRVAVSGFCQSLGLSMSELRPGNYTLTCGVMDTFLPCYPYLMSDLGVTFI